MSTNKQINQAIKNLSEIRETTGVVLVFEKDKNDFDIAIKAMEELLEIRQSLDALTDYKTNLDEHETVSGDVS